MPVITNNEDNEAGTSLDVPQPKEITATALSVEEDDDSGGKFLSPSDAVNPGTARKLTVPEKAERRRLSLHGWLFRLFRYNNNQAPGK